MLGIIVSLLAALAALSFAFHPDDKQKYADSEWRAFYRLPRQLPVNTGDKRNSTPLENSRNSHSPSG